jgi:hypothetical protein
VSARLPSIHPFVPFTKEIRMKTKILFINNSGGGFADYIEVEQGTTVAKFFAERLPGSKAEYFLIRVNRLPCSAEQVLQEGDRVSITPTKIAGARRIA